MKSDRQTGAGIMALAQATDDAGNVDLTDFEARRLILMHQGAGGLDATGLVAEITGSRAYADPAGREQVGPLLEAIGKHLQDSGGDRMRFDAALDHADVDEGWWQRAGETIGENAKWMWDEAAVAARRADAAISDGLADAREWADSVGRPYRVTVYEFDDPGKLISVTDSRTFEQALTGAVEEAQDKYGMAKGAGRQAIAMLSDTVDLAQLAYRVSTDGDFRKFIYNAGAVYAHAAWEDPSKPFTDVGNAADKAMQTWMGEWNQAIKDGKEAEFLGEAKGAVGLEMLAAALPPTELLKLGKLARLADAVGELVPQGASRMAASEGVEALGELLHTAERLGASAPGAARAADDMLAGLTEVKRKTGQLTELVEDFRGAGHLDKLLGSGALSPRELGYLARQDVSMFDNGVSFDDALTAWVQKTAEKAGVKDFTQLKGVLATGQTGELGEAIVAHHLARQSFEPGRMSLPEAPGLPETPDAGRAPLYSNLMPMQNGSGHGNDLLGFNNLTGHWETIEIKSSIVGAAKGPSGEPFSLVFDRLDRLAKGEGHWAPKNIWEEESRAIALQALEEARLPDTGLPKRDAANEPLTEGKWCRVNIEYDPVNRALKYDPPVLQSWPSKHALETSPDPAAADGQAIRGAPARSAHGPDLAPATSAGERPLSLDAMPAADQAMFAKIREGVPSHLSDDVVAHAALLAKREGIPDAARLDQAAVVGDRLWVVGSTPGFRVAIDLSEPAPSMQDTLQQNQIFNQQRERQHTQSAMSQTQEIPRGPAM